MKIKSKVFLVLIIQILWLMTAYAIPNINEDTFGINAEINNAINGNKSNEILLSTSMIELSKSKEAVEQEQYNEDLQR
ncbi:MAG: hypothetical protein NTX05_06330, partial [Fusobacteria bacterium]|nr:hypothetical protein [Fusobacteriota bacterium]